MHDVVSAHISNHLGSLVDLDSYPCHGKLRVSEYLLSQLVITGIHTWVKSACGSKGNFVSDGPQAELEILDGRDDVQWHPPSCLE